MWARSRSLKTGTPATAWVNVPGRGTPRPPRSPSPRARSAADSRSTDRRGSVLFEGDPERVEEQSHGEATSARIVARATAIAAGDRRVRRSPLASAVRVIGRGASGLFPPRLDHEVARRSHLERPAARAIAAANVSRSTRSTDARPSETGHGEQVVLGGAEPRQVSGAGPRRASAGRHSWTRPPGPPGSCRRVGVSETSSRSRSSRFPGAPGAPGGSARSWSAQRWAARARLLRQGDAWRRHCTVRRPATTATAGAGSALRLVASPVPADVVILLRDARRARAPLRPMGHPVSPQPRRANPSAREQTRASPMTPRRPRVANTACMVWMMRSSAMPHPPRRLM